MASSATSKLACPTGAPRARMERSEPSPGARMDCMGLKRSYPSSCCAVQASRSHRPMPRRSSTKPDGEPEELLGNPKLATEHARRVDDEIDRVHRAVSDWLSRSAGSLQRAD